MLENVVFVDGLSNIRFRAPSTLEFRSGVTRLLAGFNPPNSFGQRLVG